jgi:hypothetical protein
VVEACSSVGRGIFGRECCGSEADGRKQEKRQTLSLTCVVEHRLDERLRRKDPSRQDLSRQDPSRRAQHYLLRCSFRSSDRGGEVETGIDLGTVTGAVTDLATGIVVGGEWKRGDWKDREEEREGGREGGRERERERVYLERYSMSGD